VAGAIVGLISALVYWLARASGLPPLPAAGLTIGGEPRRNPGCLHEDGLGGRRRFIRRAHARTQARDSCATAASEHMESCALLLSLLLRSAALSSIADPALAAPVIVAAHIGCPVSTWRCSCAWLRRRERMAFPRCRQAARRQCNCRGHHRHRSARHRTWAGSWRLPRSRSWQSRSDSCGRCAQSGQIGGADRRCLGRPGANWGDDYPARRGGERGERLTGAARKSCMRAQGFIAEGRQGNGLR